MSGTKIDNFSISDVNLSAIMDTLQATRQGHFKLSLTNMDTSTIPQIAAGSIIDLSGSLVYFDADTSISGSASDGTTYIKLIDTAGVITAEWTATAPTFDTSKNGWYGTSASAGHRYVAKMIKSSSSYTGKKLYDNSNYTYIYENQFGAYNESWTSGGTKTKVFTFSSDVKAITKFNLLVGGILRYISIDSIVISTNTVTITMISRYTSTATVDYSIFIEAAL